MSHIAGIVRSSLRLYRENESNNGIKKDDAWPYWRYYDANGSRQYKEIPDWVICFYHFETKVKTETKLLQDMKFERKV